MSFWLYSFAPESDEISPNLVEEKVENLKTNLCAAIYVGRKCDENGEQKREQCSFYVPLVVGSYYTISMLELMTTMTVFLCE